ncbi:hypothetical protein BFP70_09885 [Thioclava sp. SK-1]|uniref:sensor histidine kinase n=1 Tax=Thioclava sp. SK-1 TaxID=1889770 RepID=UPI0008260552|nr:ATP-binding protein [Thioclava sp. SK-1]OCX65364.1 hypothetical protein BFP70_09885 [Thioclava sp. SK-1]
MIGLNLFKGASIRQKIVALAVAQILVTAISMGSLAVFRTQQLAEGNAIQLIAQDTKFVGETLTRSFLEMRSDAMIGSRSRPVVGLVHAIENGGTDLIFNADVGVWRKAASDLFLSILLNRPHYRQYRFIALDKEAHELVRVDRTKDDRLTVTSADKLQEKQFEEYVIAARNLKPNETYLSRVTLNREENTIDSEALPTIRMVVPVFSGEVKIGLIVINADYRAMLQNSFGSVLSDSDAYVINGQGDIFEFVRGEGSAKLAFRGLSDDLQIQAALNQAVDTAPGEKLLLSDLRLTYFNQVKLPFVGPDTELFTGLSIPRSQLAHQVGQVRKATAGLAGILLVVCLLGSLLVAHSATEPLSRLTRLLAKARYYDDLKDLPDIRHDEVGSLTHAFRNLSRRLKSSELQSQAILENISDGIIILDHSGKILRMNPAAFKLFGYRTDEIIGHHITVLFPNEDADEDADFIKKYLPIKDPKTAGYEVSGRKSSGAIVDMDLSLSEARVGKTLYFTGVMRDISETKRVSRLKDEFVSTVNHELRTPLTNIRAALGMLQMSIGESLDRKCKRLLQLSIDNGATLSKLVDDMLDIKKIESGCMEFVSEYTELRTLVAGIVSGHEAYASSFGVNLKYQNYAKQALVNLDPHRLRQVIVNLLSNAVKFSPAGGDVIISLSDDTEGWLRISVSDSGSGIPENFHSRVFEQFSQADSSASRRKNGTGLGLSISKKFVESFGGELTFKTAEGIGTTFHIDLPKSQDASHRRAKA